MTRPNVGEFEMHFIREGHWCECEHSCNWANGGLNEGVSVHACEETASGRWKPLGRSWEFRGGARVQGSEAPWFLVSGEQIGVTGGDSEPLITLVKAHFELAWDVRRQVFVISREMKYKPTIIHAQVDGRCHFSEREFTAMHELMYRTELDHSG